MTKPTTISTIGPIALIAASDLVTDHDRHTAYTEVLGVKPIHEEIGNNLPNRHCREETVAYENRSCTSFPLLDASIGTIIGHRVSRREPPVGSFLGASLASESQRRGYRYPTRQVCETVYERPRRREVVGYDVTYRYHGSDYNTGLPYDPGERLKVDVSVRPTD